MINLDANTQLRLRKTYIRGVFKAKYWAKRQSLGSHGESIFELDLDQTGVSTLEIRIDAYRRHEEGPFPEIPTESEFQTASLPEQIRCQLPVANGPDQYFSASIYDPRLQDIKIYDVLREGTKSYGTLTGDIYCHLVDFVPAPTSGATNEESNHITNHNHETLVSNNPGESALLSESTIDRTETELVRGASTRLHSGKPVDVIRQGDTSSKPVNKSVSTAGGGLTKNLVLLLLGILLVLTILLMGWPFMGALLSIIVIVWLLERIQRVIKNVMLGFTLLFLFVAGLLVVSYVGSITETKNKQKEQATKKKAELKPKKHEQSRDTLHADKLIRHYHTWLDYQGHQYAGWLNVRQADYEQSSRFHQQLNYPVQSNADFGKIYKAMVTQDSAKLDLVYQLFDSLAADRHLSRLEFASMVVSCVQQIPYTLILPTDCRPELYQDLFIRNYLLERKPCFGEVNYGVQSPVEFFGTLQGDCDTRTVLLYTVLKHYDYDVEILNSDIEQHSMLGVCLPVMGGFRVINGKHYYFWETTAPSMLPGELPESFTHASNWTPVTL